MTGWAGESRPAVECGWPFCWAGAVGQGRCVGFADRLRTGCKVAGMPDLARIGALRGALGRAGAGLGLACLHPGRDCAARAGLGRFMGLAEGLRMGGDRRIARRGRAGRARAGFGWVWLAAKVGCAKQIGSVF